MNIDRCNSIMTLDEHDVLHRCDIQAVQWLMIGPKLYCRCQHHLQTVAEKTLIRVLTYEEALVFGVQEE
jgi:hypothetical protein